MKLGSACEKAEAALYRETSPRGRQPKRRNGLLVLLLLTAAGFAGKQEDETPERLFSQGVALIRQDRLDEAEETFLRLLEIGQDAILHHNLGIVYQRQGRHRPAVEQFRETLRLDPALPATRALLGASLLALNRTDEAVAELELAVQGRPRDPLIHSQLAEAYRRDGRLFDTIEALQAVRELVPDDPEIAYRLGQTYGELSGWSHGEMVRLAPNSARVHFALGQNLLGRGEFEGAARAFLRAVEANPRMPDVHLMLAHAYYRLGRQEAALEAVERELQLVPSNAGAKQLRDMIQK